jgi:hypothetical protein
MGLFSIFCERIFEGKFSSAIDFSRCGRKPPIDLAALAISNGTAYLRWLINSPQSA